MYLSTFIQVLCLDTVLRYLYYTSQFISSTSLHFRGKKRLFAPFHLKAIVSLQMKIAYKTYNKLVMPSNRLNYPTVNKVV